MKSVAVVTLACLLASASAFTTAPMATRAVGNPFAKGKAAAAKKAAPVKKAVAKKAVAKKVVKKAAPSKKSATVAVAKAVSSK